MMLTLDMYDNLFVDPVFSDVTTRTTFMLFSIIHNQQRKITQHRLLIGTCFFASDNVQNVSYKSAYAFYSHF